MMVPEARIVHRIAGRMRVRVLSRKGDAAYFATVEESVRSLHGVESVEADPLTGGILIRHAIDPRAIVEYAAQKELFLAKEEKAGKAGGTVLHDVLGAPFGSLTRRIRGFTGNAADLVRPCGARAPERRRVSDRPWQFRRACLVHGLLVCTRHIQQIEWRERGDSRCTGGERDGTPCQVALNLCSTPR